MRNPEGVPVSRINLAEARTQGNLERFIADREAEGQAPGNADKSDDLTRRLSETPKAVAEHRSRCLTPVEAIFKLFDVGFEVLRADGGLSALDAHFQVPPEAFDVVHRRVLKADILVRAAVHRFVDVRYARKALAKTEDGLDTK